jgi:hypothetical protein
MTSKTTSKMAAKPARKNSVEKSRTKHSAKKSNRINRQRRLQKQLQALLLERHSRRCIICHHPEREAIEEEFVHWRAPWKLAQDYKLADYRTIYRHARAAGLLLQRRERLHSALDAFVESVDDVTVTGDTILRAMRAYTCIDNRGRWTEIPTQVQFSTSHDGQPPQPTSRRADVSSDVIDIAPDPEPEDEGNALEERVTAFDVVDVVRKYANQISPSDDSNAPDDEYDELEDDDSDADEEDAENELEELVTSFSAASKSPPRRDATAYSSSCKSTSPSDTSAYAASPAQAADVAEDEYADLENDDDSDNDGDSDDDPDENPRNKSESGRLDETTACADSPAQALPRDVIRGQNPNDRSLSDRTDCAASPAQSSLQASGVDMDVIDVEPKYSNHASPGDAFACADSPAKAFPRDVICGQNPNDRSPSDRTASAAPSPQPAAPSKPAPDRVMYKIHITPGASPLPPSETDAQRAADLIYRSVIKKYGNP